MKPSFLHNFLKKHKHQDHLSVEDWKRLEFQNPKKTQDIETNWSDIGPIQNMGFGIFTDFRDSKIKRHH